MIDPILLTQFFPVIQAVVQGQKIYILIATQPILIELPNIQVMNQNSQLQLKSHIK